MSIEIIEAAPDNLLTTLDRVKNSLGISNNASDDTLEFMIAAASDFAARFCGRQFARQKIKEGMPIKGVPDILLSLTPVVEIDEILLHGNIQDIDNWGITNAEAGIIQCSSGLSESYFGYGSDIARSPSPFAKEVLFVTYDGGYILPGWGSSQGTRTLPYDLERAIVQTVTSAFKASGTSGGIVWDGLMSSYKIGDTQVSWGNKSAATETSIDGGVSAYFPPSALAVLNWYKRAY